MVFETHCRLWMNVKILRYEVFLGLSALDLDLDLMRHAGKVRFGFRLVVFSLYVWTPSRSAVGSS